MVGCSGLTLFPLQSGRHRDLSMNNLTELQPGLFRHLRFLEELRLSGNHLSHIPGQAFSGLYSLKILRLDANLISLVPERSFEGLSSLRHLWLDDNALTEIPVRALNNLPALQAMTLALNRISHIPDFAFQNLTSLVVLHLHNNRIQHLGTHGFEGLRNLETLRARLLCGASLWQEKEQIQAQLSGILTFQPLAEKGFHNNNIKAIPEKAFMGNPLLQTISLNGATDIQEFPDLKGTTSLEILTLTRAGIQLLPPGMCQQLPRLRVLELSHNQIKELPSLHRCQKLEEIGLQHNRIWEIGADTFSQLSSLQALDLSWNSIRSIHPEAFSTLRSLVKLDLTDNQLSTLPLAGLGGLMHLKLKGNPALSQAFSKESFPKLRILEVPYAYQCCAYGVCASFSKTSGQWQAEDVHLEEEEAPKKPLGLLAGQAETHYDLDLDELQLEMEDSKPHLSVQCSPVPGPFKPCEHLFESWGIRLAVWAIALLSVLCNGLVLLTPAALGLAVALVLLNSFCFLVVAGAYIRLYCDLPRGDFEAVWDCAMVKHVAWLIVADGLLYCPVAFLSFASMLSLFPVTPEALKSVLLVVLPLPACLNPLLYLLFNPHFRDDLRRLCPWAGTPGPLAYAPASELEKSSCDSTQALVAFSDVDLILEASEAGRPPGLETYGFPSVTLISYQQPVAPRLEGSHFAEPEGAQFGTPQPCPDGELLRRAEGASGGDPSVSGVFRPSGSVFAPHL
ncbi:Leucine-rich repeat-containing G-protein coupled receptor 6 [Fukomys damarensis]|uniref:Leucine-rich repeat-containing G-protein coupled receptor 6 n=1 Tax=Fukomys damarensis TaxID=885580 RepID=A0A091D1M3_FUKDA|nr:Leucine-rich repeat-containing G-protein coupled receptor 6 [Fukomys damarensis]